MVAKRYGVGRDVEDRTGGRCGLRIKHVRYLPNPRIVSVEDVQIAKAIPGNARRCGQRGSRGQAAVPREILTTGPSHTTVPGHDVNVAIGSNFTHEVVIGIGDKQVSRAIHHHISRIGEPCAHCRPAVPVVSIVARPRDRGNDLSFGVHPADHLVIRIRDVQVSGGVKGHGARKR